jgi:hypothetical protein
MATEKLKFKIELYATMWDKAPHAEISVGGTTYFNGNIDTSEQKPTLIEFEADLEENQDHALSIKRSGKYKNQTIVNDKGDILKDQLLHVKFIEVDGIDIGNLLLEGEYAPDYPEPWATQQASSGKELPKSYKNVTALGFNGTWTFKFSSPFYMWLLENLY